MLLIVSRIFLLHFVFPPVTAVLCRRFTSFKNEPAHDKTYNKTCMTSKDLDQPVHPPSMLLVYPALYSQVAVEGTCYQRRLWSDCADAQSDRESSLVARLIIDFVVCWLKYKWSYTGNSLNDEAQPYRGPKRRRDEEQIMTKKKQTNKNVTYETTDAQRKKDCNTGTSFERSVGKLHGSSVDGEGA